MLWYFRSVLSYAFVKLVLSSSLGFSSDSRKARAVNSKPLE